MKSIELDRVNKVRVLLNSFKTRLLADVPELDARVLAAGHQVVRVVRVKIQVQDFVPVDRGDAVASCVVPSVVYEEVVALCYCEQELVVRVHFDDAVASSGAGSQKRL